MGVFSTGGVGLDLGSANVTICLENEGVVLREPSYVLTLRDDPDEVLGVGRDARQMLGRTPKDVALLSPVMDGAVADIEQATLLIKALSEKALGKRRALEKNRLVVSMATAATRVEHAAAQSAVRASGAKKSALIRASIAAALGAGLSIEEARGVMVVLIGGSTTEVAVLSMNGVVAARTTRTGSLALDEAIMRYIRREKGLIIGQRTAEDLKVDLATALEIPMTSVENVALRGRDARTGKPATAEITSLDVQRAILPPLDSLLESIREAFENTPAELAEDLLTNGIHLSGGGALLEGLRERLTNLLGIPVNISENPQDEVARGACIAASDDKIYQKLQQTGCLLEV
ncbi:MAG: rod shape-determining protein [Aristaeellaceae bacterium]|nr:rod shape-determining protein [Eubacteriales bacterium]